MDDLQEGYEILERYGEKNAYKCLGAAFGNPKVLRFFINEIGMVPSDMLLRKAFDYRDRTTTAILLENREVVWNEDFHAKSVLNSIYRAKEATRAILQLRKVMNKNITQIIARAVWSDRVNVKW